jgi:hypothetical protein
MNTWTPLWSKVVDSSLWSEPDVVVKVFLTMLAKKDADHIVRGNAFEIAQWARKGEKDVIEALRVLQNPDTKRIEPQPFDGRRIERVPKDTKEPFEGWLVLNGEKYRSEIAAMSRREYKRVKQAEYRALEKRRLLEAQAGRLRKGQPGEAAHGKALEVGDEAGADRIMEESLPVAAAVTAAGRNGGGEAEGVPEECVAGAPIVEPEPEEVLSAEEKEAKKRWEEEGEA